MTTRTSDSQRSVDSNLSRSAIHRMTIADLKCELERRSMDNNGTKKDLKPRLLDAVSIENNNNNNNNESSLRVVGPCLVQHNDSNIPETEERLDASRRYILQVKGLSNLSSNGTGVGFVLIDEQDPSVSWEARKYLQGNRSVFEAEYSALVVAMKYALRRGAAHVTVQLDHDVIQQQIVGTFTVEKESLKSLYWNFIGCREELKSCSIDLISFLNNHRAIDLAKKALATGKSLHVRDPYDPMGEQYRKKVQTGAAPLENDEEGEAIDPSMTYTLQFDGGARKNPTGVAGAGMVLFDDKGKEVWCGWSYLNKMSNNCAEYWALLLGLQCAVSLGVKKIICQGDSELIIKQVTGVYRVKDAKLQALFKPTKNAIADFEEIKFQHIYRNQNERADWLANYAMDTETNHGYEEI
jgi:ribonuclease HI